MFIIAVFCSFLILCLVFGVKVALASCGELGCDQRPLCPLAMNSQLLARSSCYSSWEGSVSGLKGTRVSFSVACFFLWSFSFARLRKTVLFLECVR